MDFGAFRIEPRWKELVDYVEGEDRFTFDAGWGHDPGTLYVPAAVDWTRMTPPWMHGRRDEIVARLVGHSGHVVVEDPPRAW